MLPEGLATTAETDLWECRPRVSHYRCRFLLESEKSSPIKIKSALPPPKKKPKYPPSPKRRNFVDMGFSCRKNAFFQASIKLAQPFPAPELRTENFTDTRIFLIEFQSISIRDTDFGLETNKLCNDVFHLQSHYIGTVHWVEVTVCIERRGILRVGTYSLEFLYVDLQMQKLEHL